MARAQKSQTTGASSDFDSSLESLLAELVSIPSAAPEEKALAYFCADRLRKAGFSVQLQEWEKGRFNVIADKAAAGSSAAAPRLLLSSHLDTVPPFSWGERNPYSMEFEGDYVRGLGVYDMKGGLALILRSAERLRPSPRMALRVVLTSDEELISAGTWAAASAGHYRGVALAVVPEIVDTPTTITETPFTSQPLPIVLGRRGRAVYRVSIQTPSLHGAEGRGVSALDVAAQVGVALREIPMPTHPRLPSTTAFVRRIAGESQALEIPTQAQVDIDAHLVPPYTHETFGAFLREELGRRLRLPAGGSFELSILPRSTPYLQPYEADLANPHVRRFMGILPEQTHSSVEYGLTVADENILASLGIPCISWAPRGGCAHTAEEWLSRRDLARMGALYPQALQRFLDGA